MRCYERTSKNSSKLTSVVNNSKNQDCKPCASGDQLLQEMDMDALTDSKPVMAVPTGNLGGSNCTINISLKLKIDSSW